MAHCVSHGRKIVGLYSLIDRFLFSGNQKLDLGAINVKFYRCKIQDSRVSAKNKYAVSRLHLGRTDQIVSEVATVRAHQAQTCSDLRVPTVLKSDLAR